MKPQHLSDEAVAAFADGVLSGHARDRACRHLNACVECRQAVQEQREAAAALRTAPPPALPTNLLDKLRTLPLTAPLPAPPPSALAPDGSAVFPTFAPMAAFAPTARASTPAEATPAAATGGTAATARKHRGRTYLTAAVLAGVTGALVAGGVSAASEDDPTSPAVQPVSHLSSGSFSGSRLSPAPVQVFHGGNRP